MATEITKQYVKIKSGVPSNYLSKDKVYEAVNVHQSTSNKHFTQFDLRVRSGVCYCLINNCPHLHGGNWEFVSKDGTPI